MKGYKAFNKDLKCRDMQYKIGKEYTFDGEPIPCEQGFHFCKSIVDCYKFYDMSDETRICKIIASGDIITDDDIKYCTNKIKIVREVKNPRVKSNSSITNSGYCNSGYLNSGDHNSGDQNVGNRNSGDKNLGNMNSGSRNSGYWNSGSLNSGDNNSGDWNSGDFNSGDQNSGDWNSGNQNSGYLNSGDQNSGERNSGYCNSGHHNSGYWNSGSWNSGIFNTSKNPKIKIFDKVSEWTIQDWKNSKAFHVMLKCPHSYSIYIGEYDMSDEEKTEHPECEIIGGYIKKIIVTDEDRQKWWDGLSENEKQSVYDLPNFDAEKFKQCTGITIEK